jgi:hypothetical protein
VTFSLIGNQAGQLTRKIGTSRRGEPIYADRAERVMVDVIHLSAKIQPTSVRTDSSATRGNAEEMVAAAKILFRTEANPKRGDRFVIHGVVLRIESIEARVDTFGKLDHWETTLVLWDDDEEVEA